MGFGVSDHCELSAFLLRVLRVIVLAVALLAITIVSEPCCWYCCLGPGLDDVGIDISGS